MGGGRDKDPVVKEGFGPIDIPASTFFWLLQPWKEGKLVTIDGWGRFAEIFFIGANKMQIKPLCDFPRAGLDKKLIAWPEAGLIAGSSGKVHHLAAIDEQKTKSHVPLLSWVHDEQDPVLLDSREGLVSYSYSLSRDDDDTDAKLFIYNYKEDKMIFEGPNKGFNITPVMAINDRCALSWQHVFNGKNVQSIKKVYNWRTNEITENDLTKAVNKNKIPLLIRPYRNIHLGKRCLFGYSDVLNQRTKTTWDENYSDVKITPLNYLRPDGKGFDDFVFSPNGMWATTLVRGYKGIRDERLYKRAFFHLDDRYPNGISMPVITEDYENYQRDYSAFVEHPVYGMCCAQEWHKQEGNKDKLYLRLYRMEAVLAEINRQLLEKAGESSKR